MVSLECFLLQLEEVSKFFFLWKRDTVDALQRFSVAITQPVGLRVFRHLKRLHVLRRQQVRTGTQIHEFSHSEHGGNRSTLLLNELSLKLVIAEKVECLVFAHKQLLKGIIFVDYLFYALLKGFVIVVADNLTFLREKIVKESVFDRWADSQVRIIKSLLNRIP